MPQVRHVTLRDIPGVNLHTINIPRMLKRLASYVCSAFRLRTALKLKEAIVVGRLSMSTVFLYSSSGIYPQTLIMLIQEVVWMT